MCKNPSFSFTQLLGVPLDTSVHFHLPEYQALTRFDLRDDLGRMRAYGIAYQTRISPTVCFPRILPGQRARAALLANAMWMPPYQLHTCLSEGSISWDESARLTADSTDQLRALYDHSPCYVGIAASHRRQSTKINWSTSRGLLLSPEARHINPSASNRGIHHFVDRPQFKRPSKKVIHTARNIHGNLSEPTGLHSRRPIVRDVVSPHSEPLADLRCSLPPQIEPDPVRR